jgi:hypothetical protein
MKAIQERQRPLALGVFRRISSLIHFERWSSVAHLELLGAISPEQAERLRRDIFASRSRDKQDIVSYREEFDRPATDSEVQFICSLTDMCLTRNEPWLFDSLIFADGVS